MKKALQKTLEEAAGLAFVEYSKSHPGLADFLEACREDIMPELIESIEFDKESLKALEEAHRENRIKDAAEVVLKYLPALAGLL